MDVIPPPPWPVPDSRQEAYGLLRRFRAIKVFLPLKRGIEADISKRTGWPLGTVEWVLGPHLSGLPYNRKVACFSHRYDLDGNRVAPLEVTDRQRAARLVERREERNNWLDSKYR